MEKFKLKKDARHFFKKDLSEKIEKLDWWKKIGIPIELLDEVDVVYIEFGNEERPGFVSCRGWSGKNNEANFKFTIKVVDIEHKDYEKIDTVELMDEIQRVINEFIKERIG